MEPNRTTTQYQPIEISPQLLARLGGVLYLVIIAIGIFAEMFVRSRILVAGYLIRKSGYLPRMIGTLYQIAGAGYIANTFALIVAPAWSGRIFMAVAPVILVGEVSLAIWLLVKGIDPERWNRRQLAA